MHNFLTLKMPFFRSFISYNLFLSLIIFLSSCATPKNITYNSYLQESKFFQTYLTSANQEVHTEVYFSPKGGALPALQSYLQNPNVSSCYIQAFSFTSKELLPSLLALKAKNIPLEIIVDKSQENYEYSLVKPLASAGVTIYIDEKHAIAHNKIIILSGEIVLTGSYNFTDSAENKNAENLIILKDAALAKKYLENFEEHKKHSRLYKAS